MLLRNVNWTAHDSERWIVIGPNGAGKTTLLQVAGTLLFPTEGTVEVLGERGCSHLIRREQPSASSSSTARVTSEDSYSSFQRPRIAYDAVSTRSMTFSPEGTRSASAALVSPIRGRRSNTSTSPSR